MGPLHVPKPLRYSDKIFVTGMPQLLMEKNGYVISWTSLLTNIPIQVEKIFVTTFINLDDDQEN